MLIVLNRNGKKNKNYFLQFQTILLCHFPIQCISPGPSLYDIIYENFKRNYFFVKFETKFTKEQTMKFSKNLKTCLFFPLLIKFPNSYFYIHSTLLLLISFNIKINLNQISFQIFICIFQCTIIPNMPGISLPLCK